MREDFGFDLLSVEVARWPRMDALGAYALCRGRGDFADMYVCEIPPGSRTSPQRHLYEAVVYVLSGRGSTTLDAPEGKRSFEWREGSLFALPLNARYQHFNGSGQKPARFAAVTDLPLVFNVFRSESFIFENEATFPERFGDARYNEGDGRLIPRAPGRHIWETNFVPDLRTLELKRWEERGGGSSNIVFALADGTMHAHISEIPVGTYKKAHRHGADFHVFTVSGHGYSLYWHEGDPKKRTPADNATVRNVYVVGPDKKIKLILVYPMTTGRNFDEVLRVVDSLQLTATHRVATPVNWKQGEDVIIAGSISNEEAKEIFGDWKAPKQYIRIVPQPQ